MTLIVLHYGKDTFLGFSDSRASHKPHDKPQKITDRFTKLFLVPYDFSTGSNPPGSRSRHTGKVGFAFAGDILLAIALQSMSGNLLSYMHDAEGSAQPPAFQDIVEVFERAAKLLHEDTLLNPRPYEAYIFGFCPSSGEPNIALLTLKQNDNRIYEITAVDMEICEGITYSIGSGAPYFRDVVTPGLRTSGTLEDGVLKAVRENPDRGTGGPVQAIRVSRTEQVYEAILQAHPSDDDVEIFVSGVSNSEFGKVSGYHIGRTMMGIGVPKVVNRRELRRLGYEPDSEAVTPAVSNMAGFIAALRSASSEPDVPVHLDQSWQVASPQPQKGVHYFSKICSSCFLMTPVLIDETKGKKKNNLVSGSGLLWTECYRCGSRVELRSDEFISRPWK